MPPTSLHMTALEITHSLTASEIDALVDQIRPYMETITDFPSVEGHRARLVRPTLSFDAQALALSYLPAAGEDSATKRTSEDDAYTYHHLRRDLFALATKTGVKVASRYVVPSAHLTVGRFIESTDFETEDGKVNRAKVSALVKAIEEINEWLQKEYWPREGSGIKDGGEWIVGQEKGLDFRHGALWYGNGGETVRLGKGF